MSKPKKSSPHDQFFKATFSEKEIASTYFRKFLPPEIVRHLDIDNLILTSDSFITENLKDFYADLVYTCPYGKKSTVYLTLLFEHKSKQPLHPHIQLLRYMLECWEQQLREKQPISVVLPIIVYHGKRGWKKRRFSESFKGIEKSLEPYIPHFEFLVTDLSTFSDESLQKMQLGVLMNVLLAFKHHGENEYIRSNFEDLFVHLENYRSAESGRNLMQVLFVYLSKSSNLDHQEMDKLIQSLPEPFKPYIMSTYDKIILEGVKQGVKQGIEQGIEQGLELGDKKRAFTGIKNMLVKGFSIEDIASILEVPLSWVREVQEQIKN